MRLKLPLLFAASLLAIPSVAMADPASCGFDLDGFYAAYDCQVDGVGGAGTLHWCPGPFTCADLEILSCYVDTTPPWLCSA